MRNMGNVTIGNVGIFAMGLTAEEMATMVLSVTQYALHIIHYHDVNWAPDREKLNHAWVILSQFEAIIGESTEIQEVKDAIKRHCPTAVPQ